MQALNQTLSGSSITLIVTGSIAAYKSAELVRELVKREVAVHVVMTAAATEFITPLTMQTLSNQVVTTDLFDLSRESEISHITLADRANLIVVAPATADIIAKAAAGIADDAASTILLATKAPIVFAPAMNVNMWENAITQRNVQTLRAAGCHFIEPEEGDLACGWVGAGRLAPLEQLLSEIESLLAPRDLQGAHVVVTAGPTQEAIDPVRFLSNRATGLMGYEVANFARNRGAEVTLISGPSALTPPSGIEFVSVTSAVEMQQATLSALKSPGASAEVTERYLVMAAAVADHRPSQVSATKLKNDKSKTYSIELEPAPDILREVGEKKKELEKTSHLPLTIVGFALETPENDEQLVELASAKRKAKGADLLVGNTVAALGSSKNSAVIVGPQGVIEYIPESEKSVIANKILSAATAHARARG